MYMNDLLWISLEEFEHIAEDWNDEWPDQWGHYRYVVFRKANDVFWSLADIFK